MIDCQGENITIVTMTTKCKMNVRLMDIQSDTTGM